MAVHEAVAPPDAQVTPKAAGDKALAFGLKFALCTSVACEPRKETLDFTLRVH